MKIRFITWCYAISLALIRSASAQGFVNLDFEDATIVPDPSSPAYAYGAVYASDAIPGWTGYLGTYQVTDVLYNDYTLGDPSIDIVGPSFGGIEGQYTLVLQPGGDGTLYSASVSQAGMVPVNAQSIEFKARMYSSCTVALDGQDLSLVPLGTGANYTLYGADISQFAGQVETLTITALAAPNTTDYFDSIVFSPSPVPEPSTLCLLSVWISFLCWRMKRSNTALEPL